MALAVRVCQNIMLSLDFVPLWKDQAGEQKKCPRVETKGRTTTRGRRNSTDGDGCQIAEACGGAEKTTTLWAGTTCSEVFQELVVGFQEVLIDWRCSGTSLRDTQSLDAMAKVPSPATMAGASEKSGLSLTRSTRCSTKDRKDIWLDVSFMVQFYRVGSG